MTKSITAVLIGVLFSLLLFSFSLVNQVETQSQVLGVADSRQSICTHTLPGDTGQVTGQVDIPATGSYAVWTRMMIPDHTRDTYWLQIDNDCGALIGGKDTFQTNEWVWVNVRSVGDGTYPSVVRTLEQGLHSVRLIGNAQGVRIDRLLFTLETQCVPVGNGDNCMQEMASSYELDEQESVLPLASFKRSSAMDTESSGIQAATVMLTRPAEQNTAVTYQISGTAVGGDFLLGTNTVIIPEGAEEGYINFTIIDDDEKEGSEDIVFTLEKADYAVIGKQSSYTYTVIDND